jgi:hypothetical protein
MPLPAVAAPSKAGDSTLAVPFEETPGQAFPSGTVPVPEDRDAPDGRLIGMSHVMPRSGSLAPFGEPVIRFRGRPGGSAPNALALIPGGAGGLRASRDVIVVGARGTAHAGKPFCPVDVGVGVTDPATHEATEIDAFGDPGAVRDASANRVQYVHRGARVPDPDGRGVDPTRCDRANAARDTIAPMQAPDHAACYLSGGSCDTTVARAVKDRYATAPDRDQPAIRSVVLDSGAPRDRAHHGAAPTGACAILRVMADCEADSACDRACPGLRQRTIDLLWARRATIEALPDAEGDGIVARPTSAAVARSIGPVDRTTHRVVTCNEENGTILDDRAVEACRACAAPRLIDEAPDRTASRQVGCEQFGLAAETHAPPPQGIASDLPTLVPGGAPDTGTPVEWGTRTPGPLTNATVGTTPMTSHAPGLSTGRGNAILKAFALSPETDLDPLCAEAARAERPDARRPASRTRHPQ